ncbi:MAG: xanthine dehydrogenase family protein molybdopterin-binding subunit [Chloroflexi bacterium]|nr:xanthine dehydrogenase family protein molybdopterin-binding subunit [Chloroflexota bacterium]
MAEYRHLGKPTPRKDARDIVTGKIQYIDDIRPPKMLYGKVLKSPHPHASIKNIDVSRAEAYPGVKAVLTYKNMPPWRAGTPPHRRLLDSKVRFVGDGVALVAAESPEIAEEALELIVVDYELLPAVYDPEEATRPGAPQLYADFPGNVFPRGAPEFGPHALQEIVLGDVDKGFREADFISEGTYAYENIPNPLPPEPPGVVAHWEDPTHLTIWIASQSASMNRMVTQPFMGLIDVRAISTQCGGSYGTKNGNLMQIGWAAVLARATGRPVQIYLSKEEHFTTYTLRLGSRIRAKVGIKKDGTVTAVAGEWVVNAGAAAETAQGMVAVGCGEAQVAIRCQNWNLQPRVVCTNRNPSGVVRGFGGQELKSALMPVVTLAVEKAGLDPLEFYKKNFVKKGDGYFWRDGNWHVCRGVDYTRAMDRGAEVFGWKEKWKGWCQPTSVNGAKRVGVGVGIHGNADIGEDPSEAYVRLNPDGTAVISVCASESGMGQRSSLCKMVAEVLDLPLDKVNISPPDTLVNPFDFGMVGSRGTYAIGAAVINAAEDARKKLFELAAPVLGAKPEDLKTRDGRLFPVYQPEKSVPWRRVLGIMQTVLGQGRFETDFTLPNFMMVFAEVEVDGETGKADLRRIVTTTDCGQIIDPLVLEGQLHGSLGAAGTDTALFEQSILDQRTGRIVNCNMIDYKWRTYPDLPDFQTVVLETPIDSHRFHAIGVGEISTAPGPAAVLMAVSNAVCKRITDYPATPEKVLRALGKLQ